MFPSCSAMLLQSKGHWLGAPQVPPLSLWLRSQSVKAWFITTASGMLCARPQPGDRCTNHRADWGMDGRDTSSPASWCCWIVRTNMSDLTCQLNSARLWLSSIINILLIASLSLYFIFDRFVSWRRCSKIFHWCWTGLRSGDRKGCSILSK